LLEKARRFLSRTTRLEERKMDKEKILKALNNALAQEYACYQSCPI
jgi:uncharacterized coiled-coil protein SlyX